MFRNIRNVDLAVCAIVTNSSVSAHQNDRDCFIDLKILAH